MDMDLIDKKIEMLEQITDGVAAYNAISYIAKRINEEKREKSWELLCGMVIKDWLNFTVVLRWRELQR